MKIKTNLKGNSTKILNKEMAFIFIQKGRFMTDNLIMTKCMVMG